MINIEKNALENEKELVISFYKKQIEAFHSIKKASEKIQWNDENYDKYIACMNEIGRALSCAIQVLTNGDDVYIIDELLPLINEYIENPKQNL